MSPQISFGRWTLRDSPMSKIALVGIALILFLSVYSFNGWAPNWLKGAIGWRGGAAQIHGNGNGNGNAKGDSTHYLGSIILSPKRGDKCWERGLDNRSGAMWEKGPVDCDVVPPLKTLQEEAKGLAARRLKAIGKAFSPKSE